MKITISISKSGSCALKTILQLLPLIIQAVQAIEAAFPEGGNGKAKLEAIKGTLQGAYSVASDVTGSFEAVWPAISGAVSSVVALCNQTGIFRKSA